MPTANWIHRAPEVVRRAGIGANTVPMSSLPPIRLPFGPQRSVSMTIGRSCPKEDLAAKSHNTSLDGYHERTRGVSPLVGLPTAARPARKLSELRALVSPT